MKKNLFSSLNKNLIIILSGMWLIFSAIFNIHAENNNNNIIEYILQVKEANFDRAATTEEKIKIISSKFNFVFEQNNNNINALALAIGNGDIRRVTKFLEIIDNVNDENLWVSVYDSDSDKQEPYTLADVAIDAESFISDDELNSLDRYAIVQLLINKKIHFNITPETAYNELQYLDKKYTTQKQKITEIAALFDAQHPQNDASFIEYSRLKAPRTKSFHIMHVYGEIYGYDNLNPEIYAAFQEGHEKLKNALRASLEAA
ncbi:MAG: hypothetical protein Q8L85_06790 [Alphaproteobacteria bacterium]|nr:hypothetical protein [Alphaproteobacteria bacterium]